MSDLNGSGEQGILGHIEEALWGVGGTERLERHVSSHVVSP